MDLTKFIIDTIFTIVTIIILIATIKVSFDIVKILNRRQQVREDMIELKKFENSNRTKTVEYSRDVLDLIRDIVGQVAVLKFRTFQDNNDIKKVNKTILMGIVKDIAETSNKLLNKKNINFMNTFFTEEFYDHYIIETSIIIGKEMFEKALEKIKNES